MFRVRSSRYGQEEDRPIAFLQHGLISSSETWVSYGETSWAYVLADLGFDVWMGNSRGNIYSRGHASLKAEGDYFNFSFYEMGKYDLPA
mmetsp:Transcript_13576/g.21195  ORF Transcript_13576/g.21195 Transcript_13576/m.21195 type:complete len:89 (+) Transcript_13576:212-478(+)